MPFSLLNIEYLLTVERRLLGEDAQLSYTEGTASDVDMSGSYRLVFEKELERHAPTDGIYVFRAHLALPKRVEDEEDSDDDLVIPIIVKVASDPLLQQLVKEARLYVASLVDVVFDSLVSACYGVYNAVHPMKEANQELGILILEDCGESLVSRWDALTAEGRFRSTLVDVVMKVHRQGIVHGDIAPRHFVLSEEDETEGKPPYIVGFARAKAQQECSCRRNSILAGLNGGIMPKKEDFGCNELWELCMMLKLWTPLPENFVYYGGSFSFTCFKNLEEVALQKQSYKEWDVALKEVYHAADEFCTKWRPTHGDTLRIKAEIANGLDKCCEDFKTEMILHPIVLEENADGRN